MTNQLVSDGAGTYPTAVVFPGVDAELLNAAGIGETVTTPYHAALVTTNGRRILVDAGFGENSAATGGTAGLLVGELRSLGVEPGDIDDVIMSHVHADHVGGLLTGGEPTFARARHRLGRAERDFWMGPSPQDRLFPALAEALVATARRTIQALDEAGLVTLCEPGDEPVGGLRLLDARGHTPGQLAVEIDTGDDVAVRGRRVHPRAPTRAPRVDGAVRHRRRGHGGDAPPPDGSRDRARRDRCRVPRGPHRSRRARG